MIKPQSTKKVLYLSPWPLHTAAAGLRPCAARCAVTTQFVDDEPVGGDWRPWRCPHAQKCYLRACWARQLGKKYSDARPLPLPVHRGLFTAKPPARLLMHSGGASTRRWA